MLTCTDLTFSYNSLKKFNFPDFSCKKGETLLILGNSGKGKTTLLHLLALLLPPENGSILLNQQEISKLSQAEAAKMRAENIGIVYQKPHFVASLSVLENLVLANYLANNFKSVFGNLINISTVSPRNFI